MGKIFLMPKTDKILVRIIDPDPSITLTDPMFSLARLPLHPASRRHAIKKRYSFTIKIII